MCFPLNESHTVNKSLTTTTTKNLIKRHFFVSVDCKDEVDDADSQSLQWSMWQREMHISYRLHKQRAVIYLFSFGLNCSV